MDKLQRSYLMEYDAGLYGADEKNTKEPLTTVGEIEWWIQGYRKGQTVRDNDRIKENERESKTP